jgi:hypothetical protein
VFWLTVAVVAWVVAGTSAALLLGAAARTAGHRAARISPERHLGERALAG